MAKEAKSQTRYLPEQPHSGLGRYPAKTPGAPRAPHFCTRSSFSPFLALVVDRRNHTRQPNGTLVPVNSLVPCVLNQGDFLIFSAIKYHEVGHHAEEAWHDGHDVAIDADQ